MGEDGRCCKTKAENNVPFGAFLSGGIDSGLITAIASEYNNNLKTFTVAMPGQFSEEKLAKLGNKSTL